MRSSETHGSCALRERKPRRETQRTNRLSETQPCTPTTSPSGSKSKPPCPANDTTPIGGYHNGLPVAWLPTGWKAERDGSIRTPAGRKPCEFVSPILRGYEGLRNVETAVDAIKERGARVNESCGLHITVSWNGDAAALARLISLIGNHEKAIYAATGTRRRERNHWAKQIKTYGNKDAAKDRCERDRYHLLNLTHLAAGKNRIEIRAFAGTLNKTKLLGYIQMVLGLVETRLEYATLQRMGLRQETRHQELLGPTRRRPRRNGTQPALLPTRLDQGLVQGRPSQQTIRRTFGRRTNLRLEAGQKEAFGNGPQIRPSRLTADGLRTFERRDSPRGVSSFSPRDVRQTSARTG